MGKGNVCVHGEYEGLYYIDHDDTDFYMAITGDHSGEVRLLGEIEYSDFHNWEFDAEESCFYMAEIVDAFCFSMSKKFPSFHRPSETEWMDEELILLENELFAVTMADNEWSTAILLRQKEHWYQDLSGLQKRHYQRYLNGIRDTLFEQFDTLGVYGGAWTSGRICKTDFADKIA